MVINFGDAPTGNEELPSGDAHLDDPSIPDDQILLRRIPPGVSSAKTDPPVPDKGCFSNHPSGSGMSVDILEDGWSVEQCLAGLGDGWGAIALTAGFLRSLGLGVIRYKYPHAHHALVQGRKTSGTKQRMAKQGATDWRKRAATR